LDLIGIVGFRLMDRTEIQDPREKATSFSLGGFAGLGLAFALTADLPETLWFIVLIGVPSAAAFLYGLVLWWRLLSPRV